MHGKDLIHPDGEIKKIMSEHMAGAGTAKMTEDVGEVRPTRREEKTSAVISSVARALPVVETASDDKKVSASRAQFQKEQRIDSFAAVVEV